MMGEIRFTTDDVLGEFGFRVQWKVQDHWADVEAFEIVARDMDGTANFTRANADDSLDMVRDTDDAEIYLSGSVKWDGCTELNMGQPHWCGPIGYKNHISLLEYIYKRAFELMGRQPEEAW